MADHLTIPPAPGVRVSMRYWDRSERPRDRLGVCVVLGVYRDRCPSGIMVRLETPAGKLRDFDLHWLEAVSPAPDIPLSPSSV